MQGNLEGAVNSLIPDSIQTPGRVEPGPYCPVTKPGNWIDVPISEIKIKP